MTGPGRFLIFTGDGKGKTTAALGMALRANGHGQRVLIVQFVKSDESTGEQLALRSLPGFELYQMGLGFIPKQPGAVRDAHQQAARAALDFTRQALAREEHALVILDEINIALSAGLIEEESVLALIDEIRPETCLVMTGRSAPRALVERADTVTEMRCLKHGYRAGIAAQAGVEF